MTSTQFVNDINGEIAKLKSRQKATLSTKLTSESDIAAIKEERSAVVQRIRELVARLDSSESHMESLRARAARLDPRRAGRAEVDRAFRAENTAVREVGQVVADLAGALHHPQFGGFGEQRHQVLGKTGPGETDGLGKLGYLQCGGKRVRVAFQQNSGLYPIYYQQSVAVGTTWQTYTVGFTAPQDDPDALFAFNFGDVAGRLFIDNVFLSANAGPVGSAPVPVISTPSSGVKPIEVSTHVPSTTALSEEPLPRWHTISFFAPVSFTARPDT
jgi:hypothetical protein